MLMQEDIRDKALIYVKEYTKHNAGHSFDHTERVYNMACHICKCEKGNLAVVELAAIFHDVSDWKFNGGDEKVGATVAHTWMAAHSIDKTIMTQVEDIIENMSFQGANVEPRKLTLEGQIVQDADRLDALGAIGIARTFTYQGSKGRAIYDPNIEPKMHETPEEYKNYEPTTINHFYEKLLLLKDRMNTATAKDIAQQRDKFMQTFWNSL